MAVHGAQGPAADGRGGERGMSATGENRTDADVSVVIVSYNTRSLLEDALRSLQEETPSLRLETIVVDNASTDGSVEAIRRSFPHVRLIVNRGNVGFAAASNQGIQVSTGAFVLLLNPDTLVRERAIARLVHYLEAHPEVGACGPQLCFADGTYQRSAYPWPSIAGALCEYSTLCVRFPALAPAWRDRPEVTRPVGYCSGACLLVRRRCIEAVGLLDETTHMYGEDVDWCTRMRRCGWPVHYVSEASVVHCLGAATGDVVARRVGELRGKLYYVSRWHSRPYVMAYRATVALCSLYRYARWRLIPLDAGEPGVGRAGYLAMYRQLIRLSLGRAP